MADFTIFTANKVGGGQADCFSNLIHWWWITSAQQLSDVQAAVAAEGKTIYIRPGTVTDIGAYGRPTDEISASEFGVNFP